MKVNEIFVLVFFFLLALFASIDSIFTNLLLTRFELAPVAACWGIFISIFAGFKYEQRKKRKRSKTSVLK